MLTPGSESKDRILYDEVKKVRQEAGSTRRGEKELDAGGRRRREGSCGRGSVRQGHDVQKRLKRERPTEC
eukprot:4222259-Pleurochrysis_carterae.AAC.1